MVTVPPYAAPAKWYVAWLKKLLDGHPDSTAIGLANEETRLSGKDYARCRLHPPEGETLLLSMAIEGGNRQLRSGNTEGVRLSEHDNWRKNHLGAIAAIYGRSPYFDHISNLLFPVVSNLEYIYMQDLNKEIHRKVVRFLLGEISLSRLNNPCDQNVVIRERGKEIAAIIKSEISIIDSLMRHGQETLLGLMVIGEEKE